VPRISNSPEPYTVSQVAAAHAEAMQFADNRKPNFVNFFQFVC